MAHSYIAVDLLSLEYRAAESGKTEAAFEEFHLFRFFGPMKDIAEFGEAGLGLFRGNVPALLLDILLADRQGLIDLLQYPPDRLS